MPDTLSPHDWNGYVPGGHRARGRHFWRRPRSFAEQWRRVADEMCEATHPGLTHAEAHPVEVHRGWSHVPIWLRWFMVADGLVFFGALAWALIH